MIHVLLQAFLLLLTFFLPLLTSLLFCLPGRNIVSGSLFWVCCWRFFFCRRSSCYQLLLSTLLLPMFLPPFLSR
jgi:hypothetical protein